MALLQVSVTNAVRTAAQARDNARHHTDANRRASDANRQRETRAHQSQRERQELIEHTRTEHRCRTDAARQLRTILRRRLEKFKQAAANFPPNRDDLEYANADCLLDYIRSTAQDQVKPVYCCVCGTDHPSCDMSTVEVPTFVEKAKKKLHPLHARMYDHILRIYPDVFKYDDARLNGMVLCKDGVHTQVSDSGTTVKVSVCTSCWHALSTFDSRPKQSLSNNLYRGPMPPALAGLTLAEEQLIARFRTRVFLVKLVGDKGKGEPGTQQTGYKGSVVSFEQESTKAIEKLPSLPDTLVDDFAVLFVGTKKPNPEQFKYVLNVRRNKVRQALKFLADHIPAYAASVSEENINQLPEDGIPAALEAAIVHAEREEDEMESGYVNQQDAQHQDAPAATESGSDPAVQCGDQVLEPYLVEWTATAVVDVDGKGVTPNELRERTMDSIKQKTANGFSKRAKKRRKRSQSAHSDCADVSASSDSDSDVSDLLPVDAPMDDDSDLDEDMAAELASRASSDLYSDSDDNMPAAVGGSGSTERAASVVAEPVSNAVAAGLPGRRRALVMTRTSKFAPDLKTPDFWIGAFPTLFSWGVGVPFQRRLDLKHLEQPIMLKKITITLREHCQLLLEQPTAECRKHPHFAFVAFNYLQRSEAYSRSFLATNRHRSQPDGPAFLNVRVEHVQAALDDEKQCRNPFSSKKRKHQLAPELSSLLHQLRITGQTVQGSAASKAKMRQEILSMMIPHGLPSLFVTINPDDHSNPLVRCVAGKDYEEFADAMASAFMTEEE